MEPASRQSPVLNLHANSSLPRSGSELLQALLSQHPDVYASATSPLLEYFYGAMGNTQIAEVKSQPNMREAFAGFCREGARGYYQALTDKLTAIDKSRGWLQYAEVLWEAYPDARIVCMMRDPEQIVASLERIYQANPGHPETRGFPQTVGARRAMWLHPDSKPIGLALNRLAERQAKGPDSRIAYVRYGDLCANPIGIMQGVFVHLQLPAFEIDPNNVTKAAVEDDSYYGIFGKHTVHQQVRATP